MLRTWIWIALLCAGADTVHAQEIDRLFSKAEEVMRVHSLLPCACEEKASADLSAQMPPVQQQGNYNTCVGWALGYACRSYYHRQLSHTGYYRGTELDSANLISPYFIYNALRENPTEGINLLKALDFIKTNGACPWSMSDSITLVTRPTAVQSDARVTRQFTVYQYHRIGYGTDIPLEEIKSALKCDQPVIAALHYDGDYFRGAYGGASRALWQTMSTVHGSHAVVIVGYDDRKRSFKFMNSYGPAWGDKGYGHISYDIAQEAIREAYVIQIRSPLWNTPFYGGDIQMDSQRPDSMIYRHNSLTGRIDTLYMHKSHREVPIDSIFTINYEEVYDLFKMGARQMNVAGSPGRLTVSVSLETGNPSFYEHLRSDSVQVYLRLFRVDDKGGVTPVMSTDSTHRLGNGQMAYRLHNSAYNGGFVQMGSEWLWDDVQIPIELLHIPRGKGRPSSKRYKPVTTTIRMQAVIYEGHIPAGESKLVDVVIRQ